jgi:uncharacterized membrane protein
MNKTLLGGLLILSVGFNLFFLTGYFQARHAVTQTHTLQQRVEAAAEKLGLDTNQQSRLMEIFEETQQKLFALKKDQRTATRRFLKEFRKPDPDIQQLRTLLGTLDQQQKEVYRFARQQWRDFYRTLTPGQQEAVSRLLQRRPDLSRKLLLPAKL